MQVYVSLGRPFGCGETHCPDAEDDFEEDFWEDEL
jgi:hypothetical protein